MENENQASRHKFSPIGAVFYGMTGIVTAMARIVGFLDVNTGGRSDYKIDAPSPTVRPESYRKMKRRNRKWRKYTHENDTQPLNAKRDDKP